MEIDKGKGGGGGTGTTTTRRRPARRQNGGLGFFVALLLPAVIGGGLAALELTRPEWWTKLSGKVKAAVLLSVAVVARMRKMPELYGAALALASHYMAQEVYVFLQERKAKAEAEKAAGGGADVGAVPYLRAEDLRAAAERELAEVQVRGQLQHQGFDEIPAADFDREFAAMARMGGMG